MDLDKTLEELKIKFNILKGDIEKQRENLSTEITELGDRIENELSPKDNPEQKINDMKNMTEDKFNEWKEGMSRKIEELRSKLQQNR